MFKLRKRIKLESKHFKKATSENKESLMWAPLLPVCLAALPANSLWRYYGYLRACKPLSLYLQEKEKRVWVSAWGRARSWYRHWPHHNWSEQLRFSTSGPVGHLVLLTANCRPLLTYVIEPINYAGTAFISLQPITNRKRASKEELLRHAWF